MGEFLRGWRRRAGFVSLALACAFTAGWLRSSVVNDQFYFEINGKPYCIISFFGRIGWLNWIEDPHNVYWDFSTNTRREDDRDVLMLFDPNDGDEVISLPYWSLACPLALLSACLILWPGALRVHLSELPKNKIRPTVRFAHETNKRPKCFSTKTGQDGQPSVRREKVAMRTERLCSQFIVRNCKITDSIVLCQVNMTGFREG